MKQPFTTEELSRRGHWTEWLAMALERVEPAVREGYGWDAAIRQTLRRMKRRAERHERRSAEPRVVRLPAPRKPRADVPAL